MHGNTAVSVNISSNGWAWLVCGRRLLIWQYGHTSQRHNHCHELTLPPSDLAHKAHLVAVYVAEGRENPSCIAVSPEGTVRYWPSITHAGTSVEESADLHGQECDSLTDIAPHGCVLATTTSTLVLVNPLVSAGRHSVTCRTLKAPQGWLGGLGRRMSSLIFGALPTSQVTETKLVKVAAVDSKDYNSQEWQVYVLSDQSLQKWLLTTGESERLLYEFDVKRLVREALLEERWETFGGNSTEVEVWMLDMQPTDGGVVILVAANVHTSNDVWYALAKAPTDDLIPPTRFAWFNTLKNKGFCHDGDISELLAYQLLLTKDTAYLFNNYLVAALSLPYRFEDWDTIEFLAVGDKILGGAVCRNIPLFLSKVHGLVSVLPSDCSPFDILNSSNMSIADSTMALSDLTSSQFTEGGFHVTVTEADLEEMTLNNDSSTRLKAAFINYVNKNIAKSEQIVEEVFPMDDEPVIDLDAALDTVVLSVGQDLVNDIPAGDPRWAEQRIPGSSIGSSASLQILHQLEDKQKAFHMYLNFLKDIKLWDRFSAVSNRGLVMPTSYVLGEYAEKIRAAIVLYSLQQEHAMIETAIKRVLAEQKEKLPRLGLSHQDLFYRQVTEVQRVLQMLAKCCNDLIHSDRRPQEVTDTVSETNSVILNVLQQVVQFRQEKVVVFSPRSKLSAGIGEYLPWTTAPGKRGLQEALTTLINITLNHGARAVGDFTLKMHLYDQLINLTDIVLDGRKCHIESIRGTERFKTVLQNYDSDRYDLIKPFSKLPRTGRSRFESRSGELGEFPKFVLNWYMREQKQGQLLQQFRGRDKPPAQQQALAQFLGEHPSLAWVQQVFCGEFHLVSQTLQALAASEEKLVRRKKTMLAWAQLAIMASDEPEDKIMDNVEKIQEEMQLVLHHEDLPEDVLIANALDVEKLRVMSPSDLIKLNICDDNQSANEYDFKKALDLLKYVPDDLDRSELGLLEAEELSSINNNSTFQYLLRVGYEHIHRTLIDKD
uniref:Nucleoporin Nup133/Nup155-like N-terminal domain-containing protein n=1 Tax=Timema poppense TaxID=170557 RepID=A0A7R9D2C4_TIMPO|nr:unnamed protein product [Timema poppensis]